jgi:hypothetical protein
MTKLNKNRAGIGSLYIVLAVVLIVAVVGYMLINTDTDTETVPPTPQNGITNGIDPNGEDEEIEEGSIAGTYSGNYLIANVETEYPVTFRVTRNMEMTGQGNLPDGKTFTISGTVDPQGGFEASGAVTGTDVTVTFTGNFVEADGTIMADGTWDTSGPLSGTWAAQRQ